MKISRVTLFFAIVATIFGLAYKNYLAQERIELLELLFKDSQSGQILSEQFLMRTIIEIESLKKEDPAKANEVLNILICSYKENIDTLGSIEGISTQAIESLELTRKEVVLHCGT